MEKIELKILGISSGHSAASYTLILDEINGKRKLPIVIGSAEAQSIAVQIEGIKPVRPMTHDLFTTIMKQYSIKVVQVLISKLEEGIFYADLVIENNGLRTTIDARTSDAIAIATRFNCPIYTFESILSEAGIVLSESESGELTKNTDNKEDESIDDDSEIALEEAANIIEALSKEDDLTTISLQELESMLQAALEDENYDLAAKLRDEINSRS